MALYFCLASGGEACHPLHKNRLLPLEMSPLEKRKGGEKREATCESIKYWLFLRCGFFRLRKKQGETFCG